MTRHDIMENYPEENFIFLDGEEFDAAIVGVNTREWVVVYSISHIISILCDEGMTEEDALEHFEYNIRGSNFAHNSPVYIESDWFKPSKMELRAMKLERITK